MRIAVDAMGGDYAPEEVIKGALDFVRDTDVHLVMVGDEEKIRSLDINHERVEVMHAAESIGMQDSPTEALKREHDFSVTRAVRLVREGYCQGVVTAGNTGAAMASALTLLGRIKGIKRPGIAIPVPSFSATGLLLDAGAMVDCDPQELFQFGMMGSVFARRALGIENPRIGLLNIGEEDKKGNEVAKQAYALLKDSSLNFVGNVEGNKVFHGVSDVIVCDGFVGNIVLKTAEGVIKSVAHLLEQSFKSSKFPMDQMRQQFDWIFKRMNPSEYGGAPLLGVKGTCIIAHGSSKAVSVRNALSTAQRCITAEVVTMIGKEIELEGC
jgi:glycerol-3-phosphate acyltransferase PlsX